MAFPVCHQNISEEQNLSESGRLVFSDIFVSVAICQPNCLPAAAEIETKVANSVIDSFPDDVTVVPRLLADGGKDGEVRGQLRVCRVSQRDDCLAVELHCVPLEER